MRKFLVTSGGVGHSFSQHSFAAAWRAVHEHTAGWVDADLLVQIEMREWQLDSLSYLLLLDVVASDVRVRHVRLLI